ncbi:MAG: hypothetical protein ACE5G1_17410 [bacterium]
MNNPMMVLAAIITLAVLYVMVPVFVEALLRYRKGKEVVCPRDHRRAAIHFDAERAALTTLRGDPKVGIKNCSLWQGKVPCHQECLAQL